MTSFGSPYPGLRPFEFHEAPLFYGREKHIVGMLDVLRRHQFLAVVGSSGCGKSSLVRAGLLPALQRGYLGETGVEWRFVIMKPGNDPFGNLARSIILAAQADGTESPNGPAEPAPDDVAFCTKELRRGPLGLLDTIDDFLPGRRTHVLVLADQFEEIFRFTHRDRNTVAHDREPDPDGLDDAMAFVDLLLSTAAQKRPGVFTSLTMRSDFVGDCDVFRDLPEAINRAQFLPPRMTREELRDAIERPPQNAHFDGPPRDQGAVPKSRIDPGVVAELLASMGDRQDQLPLIQHVLLRMWTLAVPEDPAAPQTPRHITQDHLRATGGVAHALDLHASELYESLTADQQRIAERLFRCLAERSPQGQLSRRLTSVREVADVAGVAPDEVLSVVNVFRASGVHFLVTAPVGALTAATSLDISHESLLRQWTLLRTWIERESEAAAGYRYLRDAVSTGVRVLDDVSLARADKWRKTVDPRPAWAERYERQSRSDDKTESFLPQGLQLIDDSLAARQAANEAAERLRREREEAAVRERERLVREAAQAREVELAKKLAEEQAARALAQEARARLFRRLLAAVGVLSVIALGMLLYALDSRAQLKDALANALDERNTAKKAEERANQARVQAEQARDEAMQLRASRNSLEQVFKQSSAYIDKRVQVSDTKRLPYSAVCRIACTRLNGMQILATGVLIGPSHVLTAGYVVFSGGFVRRANVSVAVNGDDSPFGEIEVVDMRVPAGYVESENDNLNVAVMILAKPVGESAGHLEIQEFSDAQLLGMQVNVVGYPADKPPRTMWVGIGKIERVSVDRLDYSIFTSVGTGGGPLISSVDGEVFRVVGVHSGGDDQGKYATRMSPEIVEFIQGVLRSERPASGGVQKTPLPVPNPQS